MKISSNKLAIYLIVGALSFAIGKNIYRKISLTRCYRITVATPKNITGGYKTGNRLRYSYEVEGQQYKGSYSLGNGGYSEQAERNLTAHKYYVRFSCAHPSQSELMYDKEVPGSITIVPPSGWAEVPK